MSFKKYQHVERFGNDEVQGIELGSAYIFPKLDGTNSSLWANFDGLFVNLQAGSRNRLLSLENDNAGFLAASIDNHAFTKFFTKNPNLRLYGEWLVPHTLKTYRDDAWRKFWIFDVYNDETEQFLTYDAYKPLLEEFKLDYIPPLAIIKNGNYENFVHILGNNNFFIQDGAGTGEGIVIKNYDYYNQRGNQIWAKIITTEFKEAHHREMGAPETLGKMIEEDIVDGWLTAAMVEKTYDKIRVARGGWTSKYIPELLERCYYDLVTEEIWNAVKELKSPTVNFRTLRAISIQKIKTTMPEVFNG